MPPTRAHAAVWGGSHRLAVPLYSTRARAGHGSAAHSRIVSTRMSTSHRSRSSSRSAAPGKGQRRFENAFSSPALDNSHAMPTTLRATRLKERRSTRSRASPSYTTLGTMDSKFVPRETARIGRCRWRATRLKYLTATTRLTGRTSSRRWLVDPKYSFPLDVLEREIDPMGSWIDGYRVRMG